MQSLLVSKHEYTYISVNFNFSAGRKASVHLCTLVLSSEIGTIKTPAVHYTLLTNINYTVECFSQEETKGEGAK